MYATLAAVCVLGLASLTVFHLHGSDAVPPLANATMPGTSANNDFLRAPTTDPSLPSLEATFPRGVERAQEAQAPTF